MIEGMLTSGIKTWCLSSIIFLCSLYCVSISSSKACYFDIIKCAFILEEALVPGGLVGT